MSSTWSWAEQGRGRLALSVTALQEVFGGMGSGSVGLHVGKLKSDFLSPGMGEPWERQSLRGQQALGPCQSIKIQKIKDVVNTELQPRRDGVDTLTRSSGCREEIVF